MKGMKKITEKGIKITVADNYQDDKDTLVKTLRQRVNELMAINKSHQQLMAKQIQENEELKRDNKILAKQIDDYFNVRDK